MRGRYRYNSIFRSRSIFGALTLLGILLLAAPMPAVAARLRTLSPSFSIIVTASPGNVQTGQTDKMTATVIANETVSNYTIAFAVMYNGNQIASKSFTGLSYSANTSVMKTYNWTVPATMAAGTYTVAVNVTKNGISYGNAKTTFTVNTLPACGLTPSGSTVTKTVSTTSSTIATTTQCPYGGTQPTTTTVTQLYLCTNGSLSADGSLVSTTTNSGSPTCNLTPVNGLVGSDNGQSFTTLPATDVNLCAAGTASNFTITATGWGWSWSCAGSNGGTTDSSGVAYLKINGQCGPASGAGTNTSPTTSLCTIGTASPISGSGPWTWSCAGGNGGTTASCLAPVETSGCPFAANAAAKGIADGCSGAPAGTPQHPTMLYNYGSNRPGWDVAGVDYYVGTPVGTVLKDWQTINDPNVTVNTSTGMVRCTGAGASVILDEIDFSLHNGAMIYNGGGGCANITITNSNFACPTISPSWTFVQDQNGANITVRYNKFNGANCFAPNQSDGGFQGFLDLSNATIQYNWFINSPGNILINGNVVDYRYNLLDNVVIAPGAHMNYQQFAGGGTVGPVTVEFNTSYQTSCGGAEGFQFYNNNGPATIKDPTLAYNTMIAAAPTPAGSCASPNQNVVMSNIIHGTSGNQFPTTISGTAINENNYFDLSGAYSAYYGGTMTGWISSGNINMVTGTTITPQ